MLAVPADRLPAALADLDPGNRALLDLSLRRGVSDAEIGELLRKHPEDVSRGREAVLGLLADALDLDGHDRRERVRRAIAELPDEAWRGAPAPDPPAPPREERPEPPSAEHDDEPEAETVERAEREEREERPAVLPRDSDREPPPRDGLFLESAEPARRRRPGRLLALVGLLVVIGALLALLLSGGDDDGDDTPPPRKLQEPFPPRGEGERGTRLEPLAGTRGSGRIFVAGDGRLVVALRGLPKPDGTYQAWLYDSVVDAVPLGTFREGSGRLSARLPARAARYRFVDVSLEPADSNRNHSGDSVLRARLGELLER